ncbi:MAG: sugar ABC transporter permease, partial [Clostridia bacterium]|nr:sugar ABC transporter permease [Clostridia bacterium]
LQSMVTNVPIVVIFAFFMASVLNTKFIGRGFARSVMFLPVIISSGIILSLANGDMASNLISSGDRFAATSGDTFEVTTAFQIMLEDMNLNQTLVKFIVDSVANISNIVNMSAVSIVIFIAGLQGISPSIYEASYIEGATKWEVFWKISLPMVSPLILTSVVYTIVDNFCGQNNSVVSTIHSTITKTEYDIASAMAVSYSLIIIVILMVVFAVLSKVVFYQD